MSIIGALFLIVIFVLLWIPNSNVDFNDIYWVKSHKTHAYDPNHPNDIVEYLYDSSYPIKATEIKDGTVYFFDAAHDKILTFDTSEVVPQYWDTDLCQHMLADLDDTEWHRITTIEGGMRYLAGSDAIPGLTAYLTKQIKTRIPPDTRMFLSPKKVILYFLKSKTGG